MDVIRVWASSVCMAALFGVVAGIIAPSGNLEKIFKLTISIFFLTALITPLMNIKGGINFNFASQQTVIQTSSQTAQDIEKTINVQIVSESEKRIEDLIRDCAIRNNFNPSKIIVEITKIDTKIEIKSATVWLTSKEYNRANALKDAVKKELDIDIILKNIEVKE
jgi:hypothetical protein